MDAVNSSPTRSAWMPSTTCCRFTPMSIRTSAEATMKLERFTPPTKTGATTLIASSGWQIQSQQRGRHLLSQALGNWLFSLVTLFLVIAVGSRFFLAQIHTDCIRTYLSQGVAYRLLVIKSQKLHSF